MRKTITTVLTRSWVPLDHAQRFSVTALVCVTACALLLGWLLKLVAYRIAEDAENDLTARFVRHQIYSHFPTELSRFSEPIRDPKLERRLLQALIQGDVFRVKLYGPSGKISWSDEPELIGREFPDNEFVSRALGGEVVSVIEAPNRSEHVFERRSFDQIMETYVPIRDGDSIIGVVEVYRHPERLFRQTRRSVRFIWGASLGGGALLYIAMVGVVRRIANQQRRLERRLLRAAEELVEEKSKLEGIVNAVGAGLLLVNPQGRIQWANRRAELWFGQNGNVVGARSNSVVCKLEERCDDCPLDASSPRQLPVHCERRVLDPAGRERVFQVITTSQPAADPAERPDYFLHLVLDVTESKEVEAQLQQAGKLSLLGQLAGGIAHQINNPAGIMLTTITHYLATRDREEMPEKLASDFEMMERQCKRIDHSIRSLLGLSRSSEGLQVPVELQASVDEAILLTGPRMEPSRVLLETWIEQNPCIVKGDPNELLQVVLNLINNAIDAMPEGGELRIELRALPMKDGSQDEKPRILLSVTDSGPGIAPEHYDRIFEPFFTTKELGSGTGLGLAISKRIVESLGGTIRATSGEAKGACLEVHLPPMEVSGGS